VIGSTAGDTDSKHVFRRESGVDLSPICEVVVPIRGHRRTGDWQRQARSGHIQVTKNLLRSGTRGVIGHYVLCWTRAKSEDWPFPPFLICSLRCATVTGDTPAYQRKTETPLKEQHEITIADEFLKTLGFKADFLRHGKDGIEPDAIYSVGQQTLGIEIATAYYDKEQAKGEWDVARRIRKFVRGIIKMGVVENPDKLIGAEIQDAINTKCSKTYSGVDLLWLCIYQHAPLAEVWETEDLIPRLEIPSKRPFANIYLGFYGPTRDGGGFRVYDLLGSR